MKLTKNNLYFVLYFLMVMVHFAIWQVIGEKHEVIFFKYYLFLSVLFIMVITILSIFQKLYPQYLGFVFMGFVLFKLTLMFLVMQKLNLSLVPYYKLHFIAPYLISLAIETLYAIHLIKGEKNQ